MTLNLRMVLEVDRAAGKAALEDTARGIKSVTAATGEQATKSRAAAQAADVEAAAKRRNAAASREVATANRSAAGATGNLVANLNDIGMMLAAGQNPLQLAIQQGTQITQVIGPMGAAGAARALGDAFVSMVSPLNLITLGVIAVSGVMINWLTSSSSEAETLNAGLERQKAAIEGIVAETERLRLARGMMLSGAETEDEQVLLERNNQLLRERATIDEQLANQAAAIGTARGAAALAELEARRAAINVEIGANNEKLVGLARQRELNAATENAIAIANAVKSATQGITGALNAADGSRLQAAFASAFPLASQLLGMAQGIIATLGQASQMAAQDQFDRGNKVYSGRGGDPRMYDGTGPQKFVPTNDVIQRANRMLNPVAGGSGGGGAAAAKEEADALEKLIQSLEDEIEALRVQDPIQQEMLKHREALAGATEAERQKVEDLIAAREREQLLMEGAKARAEFFESLGTQALDALINKGESFNDVLKNIINSLIQAAIQAAIFGTGPFGSLFGGKSILAGLFPALGGKAEGGMVHGPGTGTSDSILTALSNGEYVVNAKATARNRHLLEAINSGGRIGGYADGGYVGSDVRRMAGRGGGGMPGTIYMDLRGSNGDQAIEERVRRGSAAMIAEYDRQGLPISWSRVAGDQRRRG